MEVLAQAKRRVYVVRRAGTEKGEVSNPKRKAGKRAKPETGADDAPGDCCRMRKRLSTCRRAMVFGIQVFVSWTEVKSANCWLCRS